MLRPGRCPVVILIGGPIQEEHAGIYGAIDEDFGTTTYATPAEFRAGVLAALGINTFFTGDSAENIDVNQVILKGLTVKGIYGREMFDTWYKAVAMLGSGLDVSAVISHRFVLDDHEAAFAALRSGEASKVILEIGA